jgi:hypothetical protein
MGVSPQSVSLAYKRGTLFPDAYLVSGDRKHPLFTREKAESWIPSKVIRNGLKRCSRCDTIYPATGDYFIVNTMFQSEVNPHGVVSPCRECYREVKRIKYRALMHGGADE